MVIALAAYDLLLVAAILMLEEHYAIDILVGVPLAMLAIAITARPFASQNADIRNAAGEHAMNKLR